MAFTTGFGLFVMEGDSITCDVGRFKATARVYRDDSNDKPDERDDGFWPSRNKDAAGYVNPAKFDEEQAKAERVMAAWKNDEWFYCGVVVTVECEGVQLTGQYGNALWGVECNYPDGNNDYLRTVANELLDEAIEAAKAKLAALCKAED